MNLQQLEYIVALDNYKSFSKAAESCYVTQATLSTMVKRLEEELDTVIFDRKTSPVITTDCGSIMVEEAKKVLFHSKRLEELSFELKNQISGELRIGVIPTIAANLIHRVIPVMINKYQDLKIIIQEITSTSVIEKIKLGELDAGIISTPFGESELEEEILYYEKLLVYGKINEIESEFISPKDLSDQNIWLLERGNCLSDQIIKVCDLRAKQIKSNFEFKPNSFDSLINVVDKLDGLTLIPELYYSDLPEEKKNKVSEFNIPVPVREVSIVFHRPYAKLRLLHKLKEEIIDIIKPQLQTSKLKNHDMLIIGI
jgi:LysR family transcriptional regulator, hydrogen peroxide-inducible genes activator